MKKKIAMLLFSPFPVDDRVNKEAKSLIATKAFDVTIYAWKRSHDPIHEIHDQIKVIRINTKSKSTIKTIKHLFIFNLLLIFLLLKQPRFQIYQAHDFTTLPTAFFVAKLKRAKVVYDAHEYYPALLASDNIVGRPFIILVTALEKYLSNGVDLLLTVTSSQTQLFKTKYNIKDPVVIFNAPAISQERIEELLYNKKVLREKWLPDDPEFLIVYPGAINPGRCLESLIKAVPALIEIKNAKIILIGPSSTGHGYRDELKSLILSLGVQDNVLIYDEISQKEIFEIFCICDLVYAVYPMIRDYPIAIPGKVLFAARFEKKFITSNFGEMKTLAEKLPLGITVDPSNTDKIIFSLKKIMLREFEYEKKDIRKLEELWWEKQEQKLQESFLSLFKK